MSKSSFIIGLFWSLVIHGALLVPAKNHQEALRQDETSEKTVSIKLMPPPPPVQQEHVQEQEYKEPLRNPEPVKASPKIEPEQLREVVKAPLADIIEDDVGDLSDSESDESLPELRIAWENPEHLLEVAKYLRLRILLVDKQNQPTGELAIEHRQEPSVKPFNGKLQNYSNRVRTISAQFFGPGILKQAKSPVQCFWILIPTALDQEWIALQRRTIQAEGLRSSQVCHLEAKIVQSKEAYRLKITNVETIDKVHNHE